MGYAVCLTLLKENRGFLCEDGLNGITCAQNDRSVNLHKKFGFEELGRFPNSGYKMGQWHDVIWMGKNLAIPEGAPEEPHLLV